MTTDDAKPLPPVRSLRNPLCPPDRPFCVYGVPAPENVPEMVGDGFGRRDSLNCDQFMALLTKKIFVVGSNVATPFEVLKVTERNDCSYPGQRRTPFTMLLGGPVHITLEGTTFDLYHADALKLLPFMTITRTVPMPNDPPGAYYEIVFA